MEDIVWGDPIPVDGKRPEWLGDDVKMKGLIGLPTTAGEYNWDGGSMMNLVIPAEHPAYTVLRWNAEHPNEEPFVPWGGGDEAPGDWDRDDVLAFDDTDGDGGAWLDASPVTRQWQRGNHYTDIIGYRRRKEPPTDDADYVRVKRMTEAEWFHLVNGEGSTRYALKHLGILREETDHERFERETGFKVTDETRAMIEAAWGWRK